MNNETNTIRGSRLLFSVTYNSMAVEMRALFRREAAKAWNCTEDTARRRIKELRLRPYEATFIESFCNKHNIIIK